VEGFTGATSVPVEDPPDLKNRRRLEGEAP
jgi:hypothetical protein